MRRFDGVVFDFDGTLAALTIDFQLMRQRVAEILAEYGLAREDTLKLYVLEQIQTACEEYAAVGGDGRALRKRLYAAVEEIELAAAANGRLLPGAEEALQVLRQAGLRVGIVTRNCEAAVRAAFPAINQACDALLTRDQVERVKPNPQHLERCLELLGIAPERTIMVGDHPVDIVAGKRVGMATAGVLTGSGTRAAFIAAGADWVLEDVSGVVGLVATPHPDPPRTRGGGKRLASTCARKRLPPACGGIEGGQQ